MTLWKKMASITAVKLVLTVTPKEKDVTIKGVAAARTEVTSS